MNKANDQLARLCAYKLLVKGTVQGVGFRPFIYRLAKRLSLNGYVKNVGQGVEIFIESRQPALNKFLRALKEEAPPLARIESLVFEKAKPLGKNEFIIERSNQEKSFVFISPDIATCPECLKEIQTPGERRYQYPFTNCTNCGPRYTIVEELPYDRAKTTMKEFKMCPDCQREYQDPADRRYHAQPIACPTCGPQIIIMEAKTRKAVSNSLDYAAQLIREGKILAVKGLGGFHLIADALSPTAIQRLRKIKQRKTKPLALMADNLKTIEKYALISPEEKAWLMSPQCPIVLLKKKKDLKGIAPEADTLGFMLPYTPLHHLLLKKIPLIVATSSNRKEAPIIKDDSEITPELCDYILTHNRKIAMRADDSVMKVVKGKPLFFRRARGFVPFPQAVPEALKIDHQVLAVGGELKNTVSIFKNGYVVTSQFLGDLDDYQNFGYFQETISHLSRLFSFRPEFVVSDLHPNFRSTSYARSLGLPHFEVQHHYAHILAAFLEHQLPLETKVLGISFDGYGYGDDGQAWGGEFLIVDYSGYERFAYLDYLPLPGGDAAAREPYRMALAYLKKAYGREFPMVKSLKKVPRERLESVIQMIDRRFNSPLTSSVGRLFDAISFICGLAPQRIEFEAQAPSLLEAAASQADPVDHSYDYLINKSSEPLRIDFSPAIRQIVLELQKNIPPATIALKFHNTLSRVTMEIAKLARREKGLTKLVLAGGVFQNKILTEKIEKLAQKEGFEVFRPVYYSPGDESLSVGQIAFALNRIKSSNY
ncbi:MAG: carbamoyltransferase HypF [Candidatus Saccharicenans sp.]